jgi:hypothetical protein
MDTQLSKNENQMLLFDLIQKAIPANLAMVDVVSDLLNISTDSAYRRIRGAKLIDFEEAVLLCNHFKISLDAFVKNPNKDQILCNFTPLDLKDLNNQLIYLQNLLDDIDHIRNEPDCEMILSAGNLPVFNYLPYKELTFFILYSWSCSLCGFTGMYDEFTKDLDFDKLSACYEKIVKSYLLVPSTEIWTVDTIDRLLTLLNHHHEIGHFSDENFPLLLCEQILELIDTLQTWATKGVKGPNEIPYKFYASEIDINNSLVLFKKTNDTKCFLKLFTITGLSTSDERFCREIENWLENTEQRATLISGASEKERYRFFRVLKQKVRFLIDKIYQSNLKEWSKIKQNASF